MELTNVLYLGLSLLVGLRLEEVRIRLIRGTASNRSNVSEIRNYLSKCRLAS